MALLIRLDGARDLSWDQRKAAEERYRESLVVVFGSPDAVWRRYVAAMRASDPALDPGLAAQAGRDFERWRVVADAAAKLALGGLPINTSDARFEVLNDAESA